MLVLKSRHSFGSGGPDGLATLKPALLPQIAADRGWAFALLADERSMAGSLDFLAAGTKAGIRAAAGIQLTRLQAGGHEMGLVLLALKQSGLFRLVSAADHLASSERLRQVTDALSATADGRIDVAAFLMPGPDSTSLTADQLLAVRQELLDVRVGPMVALAEAGADREELGHAPWRAASHAHKLGNMALARLTMGYADQDLAPAVQKGLLSLVQDMADKEAGHGRHRRLRMPARIGVPPRDEALEADPASLVASKVSRAVEETTLKEAPCPPARLGLPEGGDAASIMAAAARAGLAALCEAGRISDPAAARARLETELEVIVRMGFCNYFLIVREAIVFAKQKGIPVGPGRGSVAGSMTAYALGITKIDPLRHGLLFERFINPERVSLPDIDTDFCEDRRLEVVEHLAELYGDEHVAHISTYGVNKPRGAIRNAGRLLNMTQAAVRLIGEVEDEVGSVKDLDEDAATQKVLRAIAAIAERSQDNDVRRLADLASTFLGVASSQGVHAGGIVLSDMPIRNRVPLHPERTKNNRLAVQYDMRATEACGLVKFDFLGITTLTIMQDCVDQLAAHGIDVDLDALPMEDAAVFRMIREGRTRTLFQLESGGMGQAAREIGVDKFDDIVALVALYRPGPMANIPAYAARKNGSIPITYIDPTVEPTLANTYGIIVYQEQILQIARDFAGYSIAEADILRKAIGKKDLKLLTSQRSAFIQKAVENGRPAKLAEEVFSFVLPFAEYGFNRSHAAAYAIIAYQTAWLKQHHPAEWHAACASRKTKPADIARVVAEAAATGAVVCLPDVNRSGREFVTERPLDSAAVMVAPLRCVEGARTAAIEAILAARQEHGPFRSFTQLLSLTEGAADQTIGLLVRAGACDSLSGLPPTIARPFFEHLLDQPQFRAHKASDHRQVDLLQDLPAANSTLDPSPRLWPQHQDGIRALSQQEMIAAQEALLRGIVNNHDNQMQASGWLREIEGLLGLEAAHKIAMKTPAETLATLISVGERTDAARGDRRVIQATVADDGKQRTYDVASGTAIDPDLAKGKGRVVRLVLGPSPKTAFIADQPVVTALSLCADPLAQVPPPYPVIHLQDEVCDDVRAEFNAAILAVTRSQRRSGAAAGALATRATHALLVPPSRVIEPIELTAAVRQVGPSKAFENVRCVVQIDQ